MNAMDIAPIIITIAMFILVAIMRIIPIAIVIGIIVWLFKRKNKNTKEP